jgi:3-dehydroquinate dehydratase-2
MNAGNLRVEVMHGVNLDQLGRRDPGHYGGHTLAELETEIAGFAAELELDVSFFQTNYEGAFVEHLHGLSAAAVILNPGAWTHYAYAIRDALELTRLVAVEVHLSAVEAREEFRRHSVLADLCVGRVSGRGAEGYREALSIVKKELMA